MPGVDFLLNNFETLNEAYHQQKGRVEYLETVVLDMTRARGVQDLYITTLQARVKELEGGLEIANEWLEPCRLDHHGYCQEHRWFYIDPCPISKIPKALKGKVEP